MFSSGCCRGEWRELVLFPPLLSFCSLTQLAGICKGRQACSAQTRSPEEEPRGCCVALQDPTRLLPALRLHKDGAGDLVSRRVDLPRAGGRAQQTWQVFIGRRKLLDGTFRANGGCGAGGGCSRGWGCQVPVCRSAVAPSLRHRHLPPSQAVEAQL